MCIVQVVREEIGFNCFGCLLFVVVVVVVRRYCCCFWQSFIIVGTKPDKAIVF
jgi:hypothetical protein